MSGSVATPMRGGRWWTALAILTGAVLLATVAEPVRALVAEAFAADGGVLSFFDETGTRGPQALVGTLGISAATVLCAGVVGTGLALLLARVSFPGRGLLEALAPLPIALPPLVGSFAFLVLFDEQGIVTRAAEAAGLARSGSGDFAARGWTGVLLVHTYTMAPFFYLFTRAALARVDSGRIEAARSLGAGPLRAFRDAVLPQITPAILAASLLVFLSSAGSFTAPYYFALHKPVMTLAIFRATGSPGLQASTTLALVVATLLVLGVFLWMQRRERSAATHGAPPAPRELRGWSRWALAACAAVLVVGLLLPHLALVLVSLHEVESWRDQVLPPAYTFDHYREAFGSADALAPVWRSVWTSLVGVAAAVLVGLASAALVVWRRIPGRMAFAVLAMLPFAVPGTALAVNLLFAYNTGRWFTGGVALGGTLGLLSLAYFVRNLPITYQGASAALARLPEDLLPAARSLGATPTRAFVTVMLPAMAPALAAAALLSFITALGEFVASILLYPPGGEPISVHIDQLYRNANTIAVPAAYASVLTVVVLGLSLVARRANRT